MVVRQGFSLSLWPFELPVEARSDAQKPPVHAQYGQEGMLAGRMIKPDQHLLGI